MACIYGGAVLLAWLTAQHPAPMGLGSWPAILEHFTNGCDLVARPSRPWTRARCPCHECARIHPIVNCSSPHRPVLFPCLLADASRRVLADAPSAVQWAAYLHNSDALLPPLSRTGYDSWRTQVREGTNARSSRLSGQHHPHLMTSRLQATRLTAWPSS